MSYLHTLKLGKAELVPAYNTLYQEWGMCLISDYVFNINGKVSTIPAGFWFNGASIPKLFWQLICSPYDPRILEKALVHDWLYTAKVIDRHEADAYLVDGLQGFNFIQVGSIHKAVELFGERAWKDTQEDRLYLQLLRQQIESDGRDLRTYFTMMFTSVP